MAHTRLGNKTMHYAKEIESMPFSEILYFVKKELGWIVSGATATGFFTWLFTKKSKKEKNVDVDSLIAQAANHITKTVEERYSVLLEQQRKMHEYELVSIRDHHAREKEDLTRDFTSQITALTREVDDLKKSLSAYKTKQNIQNTRNNQRRE